MEELELRDFLLILKGKIKILWLAVAIAVGVTALTTFFILEPQYQTYATFLVGVGKPIGKSEGIQYSSVLLNKNLVTTYAEIAKSIEIQNAVIKNLKLRISQEDFKEKVKVTIVENTEIIKIEVSDQNPEFAVKIANEISTVFINRVREIMKIDNVNVLDKPQIPLKPFKPKPVLNLLIAGAAGSMAGILIIFLLRNLSNSGKDLSAGL